MIGWRLTLLIALLALVVGVWTGNAWHEGRAAIKQNVELRKQQAADRKAIEDLKNTAQALRKHAVDAALAYDQATERMAVIATKLEKDREENRRFDQRLRDDLEALAADRPDLRDMRLGDDFLRHWNRSNQGRGAEGQRTPAAAPAVDPRKPARPVPAAPAGHQQRPAGAGSQSRRSDRPLPGLQRPPRLPGEGDGRVAHHGMGLVLPGRARNGDRG